MKDTIWIKRPLYPAGYPADAGTAVDHLSNLPVLRTHECPGREVLTALRTALTGGSAANVQNYSIVINLRLPRILMAIIVGAGLTCAGNTFQSLFSNPLATPDILA